MMEDKKEHSVEQSSRKQLTLQQRGLHDKYVYGNMQDERQKGQDNDILAMRKITWLKSEKDARTGHGEASAVAGALNKSGRLQITSKYGVSHWTKDELGVLFTITQTDRWQWCVAWLSYPGVEL